MPGVASDSGSLGRGALLALGAASGGAFLAGFGVWVSHSSFYPGFDDLEHLRAALVWRDTLRLDDAGPFVRVPLWQVLLGTLFLLLRPGLAIALLQCASVLASIAACLYFVRRSCARSALPLAALAVPLFAFALSPQTLLYARHAVNEPWLGALAAWVLALGATRPRGAPLGLGLASGAAAMTKLSMGVLLVPALLFAWRGAPERRVARLAQLALGAALVVGPCLGLHAAQRAHLPVDNTSAYSLGEYTPQQWLALGDARERQRAGMASFRRQLGGDPLGYAQDALHRLARWLTRPATADFALFVPGFPKAAVGLWEQAVLWGLLVLALAGTTRATAPIWIFIAALPLLCAFPVHVPFVPKILPVFPCLLLAPLGLARLLKPD